MTVTDVSTAPRRIQAGAHRDLVLMCADSGTLIVLTSAEGPGPDWARALVFTASGDTFCFESPATTKRTRGFELARSESGGRQRVRFTARVTALREPAEYLDSEIPADSRMPLNLDVALEPLSRAVDLGDPMPPVGSTRSAQGLRMTGSVGVGSVIYRLSGQGWSSTGGFLAAQNECGIRVQAAFSDESGLFATEGSPEQGRDRAAAALLINTEISTPPVQRLEADGPERGPSTALASTFGRRSRIEVMGVRRHPDQHVAFVRPSRTHGWVRVGYTPFDFARSGVTGFGLVERVTRVSTPEPPPVEKDDLHDAF